MSQRLLRVGLNPSSSLHQVLPRAPGSRTVYVGVPIRDDCRVDEADLHPGGFPGLPAPLVSADEQGHQGSRRRPIEAVLRRSRPWIRSLKRAAWRSACPAAPVWAARPTHQSTAMSRLTEISRQVEPSGIMPAFTSSWRVSTERDSVDGCLGPADWAGRSKAAQSCAAIGPPANAKPCAEENRKVGRLRPNQFLAAGARRMAWMAAIVGSHSGDVLMIHPTTTPNLRSAGRVTVCAEFNLGLAPRV